ncbi:MAG TPA: PIN domain-containing protein [Gemmatimonadaceae bacterium]|nr:PIN domain-containing protein [Gemmatimonadaceae bacterium]
MVRVAVDTSALLALASTRDQYHAEARQALARLQKQRAQFVSHALILGEVHGHLLRRLPHAEARRIVQGLLRDPMFEWREVGRDLLSRATAGWMERFADQRFSLTDAVTFELMREEGIARAFAYDQDFVVAGFALEG